MKLPPVLALAIYSVLMIGLGWSPAASASSSSAQAAATPHRKRKHTGSTPGNDTTNTATGTKKNRDTGSPDGGSGAASTPKPKERRHTNGDDDEAASTKSPIEMSSSPSPAPGKHAGGPPERGTGTLPVTQPSSPRKRATDSDDANLDAAAIPKGEKRHQNNTGNASASGAVLSPSPTPRKRAFDPDDAPAKPPGKDAAIAPDAPKSPSRYAPTASIPSTELKEFHAQPAHVQALLEDALSLAKLNLTYQYGSDDPANGGMDCSGSIAYLLRQHGYKEVPRDASGQYVWARQHGQFFAVISKKPGGFEFSDLRPGDLMFWIGTYHVDRDPPVTHTMLYLGVQRDRGQQVMWGASDGRTYEGKQRYGVSVFDFHMPKTDAVNSSGEPVDFIGYAHLPPAAQGESAKQERP